MHYKNDTIAAIATAPGQGSVALIRISGPEALSIADRIFKGSRKLSALDGYQMALGMIIDPVSKEAVDEVLAAVFRAPKSFTGEDVVEITGHGGMALPAKILELLLQAGCRLAEPGEFSRRAFLNGKLELSQAEALHDLITLPTLAGSRLALSNLKKGLFEKIEPLKNSLLFLLAKAEANLDYPEEEIGGFSEEDHTAFKAALNETEKLIQEGIRSRKIASGYKAALIGRTNVGKSSLLNALAGQEKAIVSHLQGTTRDVIEVELNFSGLPVTLMDTAGIRAEVENEIEGYGILKTRQSLERADLILWVLNAEEGLTPEDLEIRNSFPPEVPFLTLTNKADLGEIPLEALKPAGVKEVLKVSCKTGEGLETLVSAISETLKLASGASASFYINQRQHEVFIRVKAALLKAEESFAHEEHLELTAFFMRQALEALSEISGYAVQDEVLSCIFSNFCVGK